MNTIDLSSAQWRKASHSNGSGNCVEVGQTPARIIAVRDTTDRDGAMIAVSPAAWQAFTACIRTGQTVQSLTHGTAATPRTVAAVLTLRPLPGPRRPAARAAASSSSTLTKTATPPLPASPHKAPCLTINCLYSL